MVEKATAHPFADVPEARPGRVPVVARTRGYRVVTRIGGGGRQSWFNGVWASTGLLIKDSPLKLDSKKKKPLKLKACMTRQGRKQFIKEPSLSPQRGFACSKRDRLTVERVLTFACYPRLAHTTITPFLSSAFSLSQIWLCLCTLHINPPTR